ncbi:MAG: hypothetical protein JSR61_13650 [Proteobacteria bacterium]|nr:hypothetical protein [Pseudomonadota bacterium]
MGDFKLKNSQLATARVRIATVRASLLTEYIELLQGLDESDPGNWPDIIKAVREAGLDKDTLARELSCAWSTIFRWENGRSVPGPFARSGIKERLIDLLGEKLLALQSEKHGGNVPVAAE